MWFTQSYSKSPWGGHFHFITYGMQKNIGWNLLKKSKNYNLFKYKWNVDNWFWKYVLNVPKICLKYAIIS